MTQAPRSLRPASHTLEIEVAEMRGELRGMKELFDTKLGDLSKSFEKLSDEVKAAKTPWWQTVGSILATIGVVITLLIAPIWARLERLEAASTNSQSFDAASLKDREELRAQMNRLSNDLDRLRSR